MSRHTLHARTGSGRTATTVAGSILVIASMLTGCGSDDDDGGGGSGSSDAEFVIGNISGITGPFAASIAGVEPVVDSWTQWVNANGGINGHDVRVVVEDDAGTPANGIAAARKLIQEDDVLAIVGPASNTISGWYELTNQAGIPVIGGQTNGGPLFETEPLLFPSGTTDRGLPVIDMANRLGTQKIAFLYCSEAPACAQSKDGLEAAIAEHEDDLAQDVEIVYDASISGSAPNYAAQCLAAQQAGADAMIVSSGAAVMLRVTDDCASQGFTPQLLGLGAQADESVLEDPLFDGVPFWQQNFAWFDAESGPGQDLNDALQQYHPELVGEPTFNPNVSQVWAALEVFRGAMENADVDPADATPQDVIDAMYALPDDFTADGAAPPLNYVDGEPTPTISCYFLIEARDGNWSAGENGEPICPDAGT